jgi:hypothetical protein
MLQQIGDGLATGLRRTGCHVNAAGFARPEKGGTNQATNAKYK